MTPWTDYQKKYLYKNYNQKSLFQIACDIGKTERALNLYLHRHRNDPLFCVKKNNLLMQVLKKKFKDVTCFAPGRSFFDDVKIGQKRYWSLYKGINTITEDELKRVAFYFEVTLDDVYEVRQTTLFETK